jgi:hypothetical protein
MASALGSRVQHVRMDYDTAFRNLDFIDADDESQTAREYSVSNM